MQLLTDEQAPLVGWLPDETLHSWCSRYHRISGHQHTDSTNQVLFGRRRFVGTSHFLCGINEFVKRTDGVLGNAQEIIGERTIASYFLPWCSSTLGHLVIDQMCYPTLSAMKIRMRLRSTHFSWDTPLRYCPACCTEDQNNFGTAYWHRRHQLPTMLICTRHNIWLEHFQHQTPKVQHCDWLLPKAPAKSVHRLAPRGLQLERLQALAKASQEVVNLPLGWRFEQEKLSAVLRHQLADLGMITPTGRFHPERIGQAFLAFLQPLLKISDLHNTVQDGTSAAALACSYFQRAPRVSNPFSHLLMILWVFGDWHAFLQAYEAHAHHASATNTASNAFVLGVPPAGDGFATNPQPEKQLPRANRVPQELSDELLQQVVQALLNGATKTQVARQFGLKFGAVTRIMQAQPDLHDQWIRNRLEQRRAMARDRWLGLLQGNQHTAIKLLVFIDPSTYSWLYRNDRDWLLEVSRHRPSSPLHDSNEADWTELDLQLVALLNDAVLQLNQQLPHGANERLKLHALVQQVPQLAPHTNHLDRLPHTARLLTLLSTRQLQTAEGLLPGI